MTSNKSKGDLKKNIIISILVIIVIGLLSLNIYNKAFKNEKSIDLYDISYSNTFNYISGNVGYDSSTGIVELKGYAEVVNREMPDVSNDSYVFFYVMESSSSDFELYLKQATEIDENGYFVRDKKIGIGCLLDDKTISLIRYADRYSEEESVLKLSSKDSEKIMSSSKDNPVKIIVSKSINTSFDSSTPQCASLITSVELVK